MSLLTELGLGKRTLIMGVLNVTPDSFSDGGRYAAIDSATRHALTMLEEGADIIDIGGESTRPATFHDSQPLDPVEECARVIPVIQAVLECAPNTVISIDTYKRDVAQKAIDYGALILNDVSGLGYDPSMADLAAKQNAPLILMHMPGRPRQLPENPQYTDLIGEVERYFVERIAIAKDSGVHDEQIILDPGIGFGKNLEQNVELIARLGDFKKLGYPVLSGPSRKSFLGKLLGGAPPHERLEGTAAAVAMSIVNGADIVRVHDVRFMARMVRVLDAIRSSPPVA